MTRCARDIQYNKLPYVSAGLLVIALIVCASTNHSSLLLVAHSALAFLGLLVCIYHFKVNSYDAIARAHVPYAAMFVLYGVVIGGNTSESFGAVVAAIMALISTATFYTHEALKECITQPLARSDIDLGPMHKHDVGDLEE